MKFRAAIAFFTRLPVGSAPLPDSFDGVAAWLPVVGLVIGIIVGLVTGLAGLIFPPLICGLLGCLAWIVVTGGLHLDGVADCGDGLPVAASPERRLEIMKDSRLGTFGGIALFLVLLCKFACLSTLVGAAIERGPGGLSVVLLPCCMAGVLGRAAVMRAMLTPSARPGGMGELLRTGLHSRHKWIALGIALAVCLLNGWRGIVALLASVAAVHVLLHLVQKRLGGVTGDVFGCMVEMVECVALLAICIR